MPYPPNDGGRIASLNMIKGFSALNAKVVVHSMQTYKHSYAIQNLPKELIENVLWYDTWVDTKIKPLKLLWNFVFSKKPYNAVRFESKQFAKQLIDILKNNEFDIIQLEGAYLGPYVHLLRKYSNAIVSLRAHNVENEIWQRLAKNETSFFKNKYYQTLANRLQRLELNLLKKIDVLVPITDRDAEVLNFKDKSKVHVSPTGIEASKFKNNSNTNKKTLFHIGALDWLPNQEGLLWFVKNIWTGIKKEHNDWEFKIAGRNANESFVKELKKYPVNFIGEVEDALEFIDENLLMIVPLFSGSGMRIKIIEGMARGKCILTTPVGIEGIPAKNMSDVHICDTTEDWLNTINKLIKNTDQLIACGNNAFNFAQANYTNQNIVNKLYKFYQQQ